VRLPVSLLALGALAGSGYSLLVRGGLTLDVGLGRRLRPLGPLTVDIDAPRETVYDVIASPYLGRTPRALAGKLQVVERGSDMVLAAHFTEIPGTIATTLETVRFERPDRVHFRLVRGPVPHVVEQFDLREGAKGTRLEYRGELGTDFWQLGGLWGDLVARRWEAAVRASLESVKGEAERRAASES